MSTFKVDPLYVGCHTCHAQPGQQCRWSTGDEPYHIPRMNRAKHYKTGDDVRTEHALLHGTVCEGYIEYERIICRVCGRRISDLIALGNSKQTP